MRIKIQNGTIVDGLNTPAYTGDIVIEDTRILSIGDSTGIEYENVFDANGCIVSPGFIDSHTHSDVSSFTAPDFYGKITQGVTSEVIGNCGLSPYPLTSMNRPHLEKLYSQYQVNLSWNDYLSYKKELSRLNIPINLFSLVGHNTLRAAVMGYENHDPTAKQIKEMQILLEDALIQGACGLSLGLIYIPGKFSTKNELISLLEPLARHNKVLTTHLRSEGSELLESLDEIIQIAQESGVHRLHISHLKTALKDNWHKIDAVLEKISAQYQGVVLTADRYPFIESMTTLSIIAPPPYDMLNDSVLMKTLSDLNEFSACVKLFSEYPKSNWDTIRLVSTQLKKFEPYLGKFISEISELLKMDCPSLVTHILAHDAISAQAAFTGMNLQNMHRIVTTHNVCCGSDEQIKPLDGSYGRSHPRHLGSMPLFFHLNRKVHTLEKTISKMTSLPARIFGLHQRGSLEVGHYADIVVFSESEFEARATFETPHLLAEGVKAVWINGKKHL